MNSTLLRTLLPLCLALVFLLQAVDARPLPPRERGKRKRLKRRGQQVQNENPKFLLQVDLTLKRLLAAQAVSNLRLSVASLDQARQLKSEFSTWVAQQGPEWNNNKVQAGLHNIEELLYFVEMRLAAEFGQAQNLKQRLRHFLDGDYQVGQKVALLLFAADTQLDRGQLTAASQSLNQARELSASSDKPLGPVLAYSFRTTAVRLQTLQNALPSHGELLQLFREASSPLQSYKPKVNPVHDAQWLLGRQATAFWATHLSGTDSEGSKALQELMQLQKRIGEQAKRPWNNRDLAKKKIVFPYAGYLKLLADTTLASSQLDQVLAVVEALPEEAALEVLPNQELQKLESTLHSLPKLEKLFTNPSLGEGYSDFPITQEGLPSELSGRLKLVKARRSSNTATRSELLQEAATEILRSYDVPKKRRYLMQIGELSEGDSALQFWERALQLAEQQGLALDYINSAERLALYHAKQKRWLQASSYARQALDKIELAIPSAGRDSQTAAALRSSASRLTELAARSAIADQNAEAALIALAKGHQYEVATSQLSAHKEASADLLKVEEKKKTVSVLDKKVATLKAMPASETRDELLKESEQLLADSRAEFLLVSRNIRQKHSTLYSSVLRFDPLNLPDVQKDLSTETAVVQYFPTESELYIFLVTQNDLQLLSVPVGKEELDQKCGAFLKSLSRLDSEKKILKQSQDLYALLFEPFETQLSAGQRIVFIPAGNLNFLPFGALSDSEGQALLVKHSFLELAKPTDFSEISKSAPLQLNSVTAFANATLDLPASAQEAEAITALFKNSSLFLGKEATKSAFLAHGAESSALHIATHGQADSGDALKSHLKLAGGEQVAQEEILTLVLDKTSLVTLSACNTAVANEVKSDYVASLAEAFWLAGSPSVVASLWSVEDESTRLLMTEFYSGLQAGKSKVEALRQAQLTLYENPKFRHPTYWSGFILFGDWR